MIKASLLIFVPLALGVPVLLVIRRKAAARDAVRLLANIPGIACCQFAAEDVVRHPLVAEIVRAYEARDSRGRSRERGDGA